MNEEEACRIFATAWNRLDPEILIAALDENVRYTSQTVLTDMRGKEEVADYLRGKMETIRSNPEYKVYAELAETRPYPMYMEPPRPCVVIAQGDPEDLVVTVLLTVDGSKITEVDNCLIPPPETTKRSGEYPA